MYDQGVERGDTAGRPRRGPSLALLALFGLLLMPPPAAGQGRAVEVKRFQWDPVVLAVAVEAPHGLQLYSSVADHWTLTWFPLDSVARWLPSAKRFLNAPPRPTLPGQPEPSSEPLRGRDGGTVRLVAGTIDGSLVYGLRVEAAWIDKPLIAWMHREYAQEWLEAIGKGVKDGRKLMRAAADDDAGEFVFEPWELDAQPHGKEEQRIYGVIPAYTSGGRVTLGFVVAADGRVVPSSVLVYDAADANLGRQFARAIVGIHFQPGERNGRPVTSRAVISFDLRAEGRMTVNNYRAIPSRQ